MNNVFLDFGAIKIYWYSIILLIAFFLGGTLAIKEAKKKGIKESFMTNYFFYLVPLAILGARIYFVLFHLDYYKIYPIDIFKVWEGGLAIHGGIIVGIIFTYFYTKKYNISFPKLLDIASFSLLLGQAIGRWGNFMNGEAYGPITTYESLKSAHIPSFIIEGMNIGGNYYTPTFFYESLWCFLGFLILYFIIRKMKTNKVGTCASFYLIWYGLGRFKIEALRQDSLMLGNIKIAQFMSIMMILIGILYLIYLYLPNIIQKQRRKKHANIR